MATKGGSVVFEFEGNDSKLKNTSSSLGKGISTAMKGGAIAVGALSTALGGLVVSATKSYADLEQNIGGVETLFKDSANIVIDNAKRAYETAGMSANEYMETVTGFSASLLQSLGGDTEKATSYADRAITDMADNANKMGTAMESIQWAYQGFAKQNYTMLDNLKLGYGGTKEEMSRLISDASKLTEVQKELGITVDANDMSFGNIVNAISVVQKNMGIMGTTSKEAATTITGSVNSMKAAFDNFLNGSGTPEQLSKSIVTALKNIGSAVGKLGPSIIDGLVELTDTLVQYIPGAVERATPALIGGAVQLVNSLVTALPQLTQALLNAIMQLLQSLTPQIPTIVQNLLNGMLQIVNQLATLYPTLIPQLVQAILGIVPVLISNLPIFVNAGIQLLIGLAQGLVDSIPILMNMLPEIVTGLINGLLTALPQLLLLGPTLILGLAQGLINAIPSLVLATPKIIKAIIEGLISGIPNFLQVGVDMVKGLWDGLLNSLDWLKKKIKGWVGNVLEFIKGLFGIHSPSTEFAYFGKMNVLGLEEGMEDMQGELNDTINSMINLSPSLLASASNTYNPNISVSVNNEFEQDPLGQMVQKRKTFASGAKNDYNFGMGV
jgi:phage-related protein